eukprot:scaffold79907_cov34-Tisochrysis_lutea.AAC.4
MPVSGTSRVTKGQGGAQEEYDLKADVHTPCSFRKCKCASAPHHAHHHRHNKLSPFAKRKGYAVRRRIGDGGRVHHANGEQIHAPTRSFSVNDWAIDVQVAEG